RGAGAHPADGTGGAEAGPAAGAGPPHPGRAGAGVVGVAAPAPASRPGLPRPPPWRQAARRLTTAVRLIAPCSQGLTAIRLPRLGAPVLWPPSPRPVAGPRWRTGRAAPASARRRCTGSERTLGSAARRRPEWSNAPAVSAGSPLTS